MIIIFDVPIFRKISQICIFPFQLNKMTASTKLKDLDRICRAYGVNIVKADDLDGKYSCILFTQAYNERQHARDFLENVSHFTDKVIILDDGSTDGTGEEFMDDRVMIHLRREENSNFDDYSNRSLLIELGILVNTRWMLFLDLDERIDPSYSKVFRWLLNFSRADQVKFRYVHLWNSPEQYRTDYPHSIKGVQYRLRMIRKKGKMELLENKRLHFELQPYKTDWEMKTQVLIAHLGSISPEDRKRRYENYKTLDPDNRCQSSYEHLIAGDTPVNNLSELKKTTWKVAVEDIKSCLYMLIGLLKKQF